MAAGGDRPRARVRDDDRQGEQGEEEGSEDELLPTWWLFLLPLYWFPQGINFSVIQSYLMPFQIEALVGNAPGRKQMAISLQTVAGNIGSMSGPIWGTLSDKLVDKDGRRMRRPVIVFGQLLFCGACLGIANTRPDGYFKTFPWFMFFYMLFTLTANISGAPYISVNVTIPKRQRGKYAAFTSWQAMFMGFCTAGLGAALGKNLLTTAEVYAIAIALALFPTLPIGIIGLGEKPGCWEKEHLAPPPRPIDAEAAATQQQSQASKVCAGLEDFVSAMKYAPFRWMFVATALNSVYGMIGGLYFIYWVLRASILRHSVCATLLYSVHSVPFALPRHRVFLNSDHSHYSS